MKGGARRVLIVGGAGQMGRLLARFFSRRGLAVAIHDPGRSLRGFPSVPMEAAATADVVLLATPLALTAGTLSKVLALSPRGLVTDVASVKGPLVPIYGDAASRGLSVASLHPMFGPSVKTFAGHDLIVCDAGNVAAARRARALFSGAGLKVATIPLAEHDPWVARTLGLAHFLSLVAGSALAASGVSFRALDGLASTSTRNLCALVTPILLQAPELTQPIQALNAETPAMLDLVEREIARWRAAVGNPERFAARLATARRAVLPPARRQRGGTS